MQQEDYLNDQRTLPLVLSKNIESAIKNQGWQLKSRKGTAEIYQRHGKEITVEKDSASFKITIDNVVYTARNPFPFLRQELGTPMLTEYISNGSKWLLDLVEVLKLY